MILILTDKYDAHADTIINKLKLLNVSYYRFNLDVESLKKSYITFTNNEWQINTENGIIKSNSIKCVWCRRPFVELTLQETNINDVDFKIWKNEWNKTLLGLYHTLNNSNIRWLNPLRKAYKGENKYLQMSIAADCGFKQPDTIVSNEKDKLYSFINNHKRAIMKLMAQDIYTSEDGEFKGFYTNIISVDDFDDFGVDGENPIVLQEYINKQYEVRYTIVGDKHMVCRIDSQQSEKAKEDWRRYDIPHTPHTSIIPPEDIKKKVTELMRKLELEYGAIDFIVTPNNEWYFLEINCFGQWLWIEQLTDLKISDAIVEWLCKYK